MPEDLTRPGSDPRGKDAGPAGGRIDAVNYSFAFSWITASAAGAVIGWWLVGAIFLRILPPGLSSSTGLVLLRGLVIGAALGFFQQRPLADLRAGTDRWILRTTAAYLAGSSVLALASLLPQPRLALAWANFFDASLLTVGGCLMGALQSTGFRSGLVDRRWWVLTMGVSWAVGAALPSVIPGLDTFTYTPNAVAQALWGVCVGVATLYPLRGLIRNA